eukprot:1038429-Rhodomonas_salina.2
MSIFYAHEWSHSNSVINIILNSLTRVSPSSGGYWATKYYCNTSYPKALRGVRTSGTKIHGTSVPEISRLYQGRDAADRFPVVQTLFLRGRTCLLGVRYRVSPDLLCPCCRCVQRDLELCCA